MSDVVHLNVVERWTRAEFLRLSMEHLRHHTLSLFNIENYICSLVFSAK